MPIYEFKCLQCNEYMELLIMGANDDQLEMKCKKCGSNELERILSATNFAMAAGQGAKSGPATESRSCSNGSCTTWNLPGHTR
ncbi:MAG: zinc ribbon domain-containing protein [Desulfobacteraceae bacterium]|nr:zinc ribbon domain-containing protein [Desulfobacteraceae bacterium]